MGHERLDGSIGLASLGLALKPWFELHGDILTHLGHGLIVSGRLGQIVVDLREINLMYRLDRDREADILARKRLIVKALWIGQGELPGLALTHAQQSLGKAKGLKDILHIEDGILIIDDHLSI